MTTGAAGTGRVAQGPPAVALVERPRMATGLLDWLTATNHKQIALLYLGTAMAFFLFAGLLAVAMRAELAVPGLQLMGEETYNELFTMHGTIMMLVFGTPAAAAFANFLVPLQIGAADMAFPRLNALSYWLYLFGSLILVSGFATLGGAAGAGWTGYAPLSDRTYSPSTGLDLWIVGLVLGGLSAILGAVNFMTTIFTRRAPGMTMLRLPLFTWGIIVTAALMLFAFPALTGALLMLLIDRRFGGGFFDPAQGGDPILWQHVFWFFGHPEVYILVLPFFGIVSEIVPVFSRKPLFGYRAMVLSFVAIAGLSMAVWAHHMFTTGLVFLPFFSVASFAIAVPTGIKIFNWIATMWRGQLSFPTPMLFALGLIYVFVIGGISGVIVASPPLDFHLHDTYYVVGHLHNVLIGGTVYALFAGIYFWFPKATGRRLSERLGRIHFASWIVGFTLTFLPQYQLGASGMPRRYADYAADAGWTELNLLSTAGSLVLAVGMLPFLLAVVDALRRPPHQPDDPWGGNSLEWWTSSPPPHHNFRTLPAITSERPVHDARVAAARGARPATEAPPAGLPSVSMPEEVRFFGRSAVFGLVVAAVYWFLSYETAGTVLLFGFGLASLLGAFWLGRQAARRGGIEEPPWRWIALPSAEREHLFPETAERLPGRTVAPLAVGLGLSLAALALIYGGWLLLAGLVPVLAGAWTWIGSVMAEWRAGDPQG